MAIIPEMFCKYYALTELSFVESKTVSEVLSHPFSVAFMGELYKILYDLSRNSRV